ncbi:AraC-type DNA-binding protein [Tranquillimonas rosea]|uniref:AraC-type DNA-binding protein n=2 Tax=Tranquillimonas rosea TaxID=641238 RepID=A0A1H9R0J2_9RHOB|nr:AraC-type DNA-binding protein [Tranquillimonas rosea]
MAATPILSESCPILSNRRERCGVRAGGVYRRPMTALADLVPATLNVWSRHGAHPPPGGVRLTCHSVPTGPIHTVLDPSLCVVLQGAKVSRAGSRVLRYGAGECLIAAVDVPVRADIVEARPDAPYVAMSLALDRVTVAELIGALPPDRRRSFAAPRPGFGVAALGADVADAIGRLLALADRPGDAPVLAPLIRREIAWHVLNGPLGAALAQIGPGEGRMAGIGAAVARIRAEFDRPLRIDALAAEAGTSAATFHRHFKAVTAMTPIQFQKQLRLQEARRLLGTGAGDVARVAFAVGYESVSQFSREYRRLYGTPPGRDARGAALAAGAG